MQHFDRCTRDNLCHQVNVCPPAYSQPLCNSTAHTVQTKLTCQLTPGFAAIYIAFHRTCAAVIENMKTCEKLSCVQRNLCSSCHKVINSDAANFCVSVNTCKHSPPLCAHAHAHFNPRMNNYW
jgi:hypothetical protein